MLPFGADRGVGVTDALRAAAEWPVVVLFGALTQLGDGWFLFALGGCLYVAGAELRGWGIDRRRGLFVFALALAYVALIEALKGVFQLPRPPGAVDPLSVAWLPSGLALALDSATTAEGSGFPSGHALGSTMVWGGLALVVDRGSHRKRVGVAGALVVLVSLSRLVLGVHYVADVVAGVGLGVVVLGSLYRLADGGTDPERVLLVAAAVGACGLLVGVTFDGVAVSGGAIGGWIAWRGVDGATPARPANRREAFAGVCALGVVAGLFGLITAVEPPFAFAFLGAAVSVGGVVATPWLSERLT